MRTLVLPLFIALQGCGTCEFPAEATPIDGVLRDEDTCGRWELPVDDHLIFSHAVESDATACEVDAPDSFSLNAEPIFTNFGTDGPRFTFDLVALAVDSNARIQIACDDDSRWDARVDVVE